MIIKPTTIFINTKTDIDRKPGTSIPMFNHIRRKTFFIKGKNEKKWTKNIIETNIYHCSLGGGGRFS